MAIVRLAQFHAEDRNAGYLIPDTSGSNGVTSLPVIDTDDPRSGLRSVRVDGFRRPHGFTFSSVAQFWAGVWFMHRGTSDLSNEVALLRFSGSPMRYVHYIYPENILELSVNGLTDTVDASLVGFMRQQVWMHLGVHFKADASTGFCSFYLDGKKILEVTGDTSGDTSACYIGGTPFSNNAWNVNWFDDFYIESTIGESDGPPPPRRFLFAFPNAAGNDTEWAVTGAASNFQAVDEAPPDTDTTYVDADTAGLVDTYNVEIATYPNNWDPVSVIAEAWAKEVDANQELALHLYDGSYAVGSTEALTTSYAHYWSKFDTRPSGGDWDIGSVDTIQVGYERMT